MPRSVTFIVENRGRDIKDLGKIIVDGEEHHLILGSADDANGAPARKDINGMILPGTAGEWSKDFPNPVQSVEAAVWKAYNEDPARGAVIKDWLSKSEVTIGRDAGL